MHSIFLSIFSFKRIKIRTPINKIMGGTKMGKHKKAPKAL